MQTDIARTALGLALSILASCATPASGETSEIDLCRLIEEPGSFMGRPVAITGYVFHDLRTTYAIASPDCPGKILPLGYATVAPEGYRETWRLVVMQRVSGKKAVRARVEGALASQGDNLYFSASKYQVVSVSAVPPALSWLLGRP